MTEEEKTTILPMEVTEEEYQDFLDNRDIYTEGWPEKLKNFKLYNQCLYHLQKDISLRIIDEFIRSNMEEKEFCEFTKISKKELIRAKKVVGYFNPLKLEELKDSYEEMKNQKLLYLQEFVRDMIDKIQNGVKLADGRIRPYDIIDFYSSSKLTLSELNSLVGKSLSYKERLAFGPFCTSNTGELPVVEESIIKTKIVFDTKRDEKGKLIPNSGREVTQKEKEQVIKYLKENNVRVTDYTYYAGIKRCINGVLDVKDDNINVKEEKILQKTLGKYPNFDNKEDKN